MKSMVTASLVVVGSQVIWSMAGGRGVVSDVGCGSWIVVEEDRISAMTSPWMMLGSFSAIFHDKIST